MYSLIDGCNPIYIIIFELRLTLYDFLQSMERMIRNICSGPMNCIKMLAEQYRWFRMQQLKKQKFQTDGRILDTNSV